MPSSYIAIEFRAPGPESFAAKVRRIDAIPATELILRRSRELRWYERHELFGEELACRVVIWVRDALDEAEAERKRDPKSQHPYRKLEIFDVEYRVPAPLAELIESLGGQCSIVERGRLRFTTRRYEAAIRDQLAADIEAAAGKLARCEFGVERERLIGRIEGAIMKVHELEGLIERSGLVDRSETIVDYV